MIHSVKNPSHPEGEFSSLGGLAKDAQYWKDMPIDLIKKIYDIYKHEFNFFGYGVREYFSAIGMPEKGWI